MLERTELESLAPGQTSAIARMALELLALFLSLIIREKNCVHRYSIIIIIVYNYNVYNYVSYNTVQPRPVQ